MSKYKHFTLEHEHWSGIMNLTINVSDSTMNVLGREVLEEFSLALAHIKIENPTGLAIFSGKDTGFIAGANVKEFLNLTTEISALEAIRAGQKIMTKLDDLPFPTVAVINGVCLGGGLELSLACDYRIALDDPKVRLGLPEVKLGIHPGFGGMVRACRVLGAQKAMGLCLTGRTLAAQQARKMGLVDYVVPQRLLAKSVRDVLLEKPKVHRPTGMDKLGGGKLGWIRSKMASKMRKEVAKKAREDHYPAPYRMIDLWEKHSGSEEEFMLAEAHSAAKLSQTLTARNLLRVFMLQDLVKSTGDKKAIDCKHVHVIGAGAMGGDIAAHCALNGMTVTLQDISDDMIADAMKRAFKLYNKRFRGKDHMINEVLDRLIPDKTGLGISEADVIIEAVVENIDIKRLIYKQIEAEANEDAIIATNTSSIKLDILSMKMINPGRLVGLHFFNPVAIMPLVEVVYALNTNKDAIAKADGFCRHINKLPIEVKSSPGFLVNRVLMPTLVEAINMLDRGIPREDIDNAFIDFGMPMGPLHLADTVGLDVCYFVMNIIKDDLGFEIPPRLQSLIDAKCIGIKSGSGFYTYKNGKKKNLKSKNNLSEIKGLLLEKFIDEAQKCLDEGIVESLDHVDAGMIFGAGFAPFRGGPLHFMESVEWSNRAQ